MSQNPIAKIFQTNEKDRFIKKVYNTDSGLPQNTITSIAQTRDGFIWVATFGGLARFDGIKFTKFIPTETNGLINNRLTCLYEDRHGVLWIGSEEGDLMTFQNGKFELIYKNQGPPIDSVILTMFLDETNILWIGMTSGLNKYDVSNRVMKNIPVEEVIKGNYSNLPWSDAFRVSSIKEDKDKNIWFATNRGLFQFKDDRFVILDMFDDLPNKTDRDLRYINHPYALQTDYKGDLFILTQNRIVKINQEKISIVSDSEEQTNRFFFAYSSLLDNSDKKIWGARNKSLYEISEGEQIDYDLSDIITSKVRSGLIDTEGNLWIGTDSELIYLKKRRIELFGILANGKDLSSIQALGQDANGTIWAGSASLFLKIRDGKISTISLSEDLKSPHDDHSFAVFAHPNGEFWTGASPGIYQFKGDDWSLLKLEGRFNEPISTILLDKNGSLWVGNKVFGLQNYHNGVLTNYTVKNGLVNNSILLTMQDTKGRLWIGTRGGLSIFENGQFTNFTSNDELTNNNIREIYEDVDGTFWIGTYGGGILRYRDNKFIPITTKNGLAEDIASRMLLDEFDNFWVLGNQGIYTISRKSLNDFADGKISRIYSTVYNVEDGMVTPEGNGGNQYAGWKATDGKLWFPMLKGGVIIDPKKMRIPQSSVYLEDIFLDNEKQDSTQPIQIEPGQNNLEINYSAINFTKPNQISFRYKLVNYDTDWQEVGARRTAYYSQLPGGNYTFKVVAINPNGELSKNEAEIQITVISPFWKRPWFYALGVLVLIGLIVFIYQKRLETLKRKQLQKEEFARQLINAHETERNRIAKELHDSLGQNLLVSINWILVLLKQLPEKNKYRPKVNDLHDIINDSLEEIRTIARNLRPQHLKRFGLTQTIEQMVKQVANSSDLELELEIDEIDKLFTSDEELSIYRILQECFNNIIKHSEASKVTVKIEKIGGNVNITNAQDKLRIQVIDNGKGFDLHEKKKTSFGLDNIEQRVQLLGGKLNINSAKGRGTETTIYLNIKAIQT